MMYDVVYEEPYNDTRLISEINAKDFDEAIKLARSLSNELIRMLF